jgi:energy-coupling factor transporter ATP-binding protein EcfA2
MALVCPQCGMYTLNNNPPSLNSLHCTSCDRDIPTNILPFFVVTGASGSGKSTVLPELRRLLPEVIILDKDILWNFTASDKFNEVWLRIVYTLAQSGRHALICGTTMPWDLAKSEDRGLVGTIHFLNLHCNDTVREARLRARPEWRGSGGEAFVAEHIQFAHWLLENAATAFDPPMLTLDTTNSSPLEVARAIAEWVTTTLNGKLTVSPAPFAASA